MKKTYIAPNANVITLKFATPIICTSYTTQEADKDAVVLGREASFDFTEE